MHLACQPVCLAAPKQCIVTNIHDCYAQGEDSGLTLSAKANGESSHVAHGSMVAMKATETLIYLPRDSVYTELLIAYLDRFSIIN